jgi:hypothetical protein
VVRDLRLESHVHQLVLLRLELQRAAVVFLALVVRRAQFEDRPGTNFVAFRVNLGPKCAVFIPDRELLLLFQRAAPLDLNLVARDEVQLARPLRRLALVVTATGAFLTILGGGGASSSGGGGGGVLGAARQLRLEGRRRGALKLRAATTMSSVICVLH